MSVKRRNVTTSRHSIEEKLSAVRQRMYGELSFQDVLERYGVCGSTLSEWLRKYRDEVLRLEREKGIPLYVLKPEDEMDKDDRKELERLRREVADLKLINRTWEILADLGKERYGIDFKKKLRGDAIRRACSDPGRPRGKGGRIMTLCRSFGYSKQAYYRSQRFFSREERECYLVGLVEELRQDLPRLGGVKLWKLLNDNGVRVGRDELFRLLGRYGLLIKRRKRRAVTTDSKGWARQHPNLVKGLKVSRPNQVWVSDITYVTTRAGFVYLSLVTDAYSRRIMGWHVHATLDSGGPPRSLYRAICQVDDDGLKGLVHHSDRGCQYRSAQYVDTLSCKGIKTSMTQDGSPYDNAIAERVNGILKQEWLDGEDFADLREVREKVEEVVRLYNTRRPHMAIGLNTPEKVYTLALEGFERKMY